MLHLGIVSLNKTTVMAQLCQSLSLSLCPARLTHSPRQPHAKGMIQGAHCCVPTALTQPERKEGKLNFNIRPTKQGEDLESLGLFSWTGGH